MKNLSLVFIVIITLLGSSSCKKGGTNDAIADVYVRSLLYNGSIAYSTVHSVTSSSGMISVTVDLPGGEASFPLTDFYGDGTTFFRDTSMLAVPGYSHTPPVTGIYTYHVTFKNGETKDYTNTLASKYLQLPVIDSLYKKPYGTSQSVRMKWKPVDGAQYYQIQILSGQNVILPWALNLTNSDVLIYENLISSFSTYLPGTLLFEVKAILYETSDKKYIQAVS